MERQESGGGALFENGLDGNHVLKCRDGGRNSRDDEVARRAGATGGGGVAWSRAAGAGGVGGAAAFHPTPSATREQFKLDAIGRRGNRL